MVSIAEYKAMNGKTKNNSESQLVATIIQWLYWQEKAGKLFWFRSNSFSGQIMKYGKSVGYINNSKKGLQDITLCTKDGFVAIEVKSPTGKLSPEQQAVQAQIEALGGRYIVARSLQDVIDALPL